MTRFLRLALLVILAMTWTGQGRAQDRVQIIGSLYSSLVDIALIEEQRARPDVPDDFAQTMLGVHRRWLSEAYAKADATGQGRAIRSEAQRKANRIINARRTTDYLRYYPDPQRVRADLIASANGANPQVLAGRQAGRFMMLTSSLTGLQDRDKRLDEDRQPADVVRLKHIYTLHSLDIRDRIEPTLGGACSRVPFSACPRRDYHETRGQYQHDLDKAQELAALYFPASLRDRVVDATGLGGSRKEYAQYQDNLRAEREEQERRNGRDWGSAAQPLFQLLWLAVLLGIAGLITWAWLRFNGSGDEERPLSKNHGSADFAPIVSNVDQGIFKGVFLGASAVPAVPKFFFGPVLSAPESHTLIVAPSGTGKGTRVILPTLLLYRSSLITIDPKGENAAITARYRREQLGHTVHIVNPWGVHEALYQSYGFKRATFNPLDVLDPADRNIVGTANSLAVTICHQGSTNETFWRDNATAMLAGLLLWVTDAPGQAKTLSNIADIVSGGEYGDDLRKTVFPQMVASTSYRGAMRKLVGRFMQMSDQTYSGVISQLSQSIQFLADDQIATATDVSSFNLADLVNGRTTVYLVIPDDQMQAQATWLKLMVNAVTQTFKRYRPAGQGVRGMFLIDEFPVLGRVDSIVTDIALVRGAGLDMTLIVQGLDQLRSLYGPSADTIIANCGYKWFCNVKDLHTAEYVSKALGQMTVRTVNETISGAEGHTNRSFGEMGRALLFPDEIMSMGKGAAFAFQPHGRPHYLKPVDYWHLSAFIPPRAENSDPPIRLPDLTAFDPNPFFNQRQSGQGQAAGKGTGMDRAEALAMLGLEEGATPEQIREAYKRLMGMLHPDRGGTTYLAQKLNEARDLLLGKGK